MPTYLIHGFRWHRPSIRIHIVLYDLEDAAPEWIIAPATAITLLNSFYTLYDFLPPSNVPAPTLTSKSVPSSSHPALPPGKSTSNGSGGGNVRRSAGRPSTAQETAKRLDFNSWSAVKLLEQYDPNDLASVSQPYAYVADYMIDVKLSADITAEMAAYNERSRNETAMMSPAPMSPGPASPAISQSTSDSSLEGGADPRPGAGLVAPEAGLGEKMSAREYRRKSRRVGWFDKLRDSLQKDEEIGWHVVVCGDEERMEGVEDLSLDDDDDDENDLSDGADTLREMEAPPRTPRSAGLKGFFRRDKDRESKSSGSLK